MTGKKKILMVEYFPFMGGGQRVLLDLARGLGEFYDIEILAMNHGAVETEAKKLGIKISFIQPPKKVKYRYVFGCLLFLFRLLKFLSKSEYNLVYAGSFIGAKLAGPACIIKKIPLIWHKQLIIEKPYFSYSALQLRLVSTFSSKIICVSEASRMSMEKAGVNHEKLSVIYNGTGKVTHDIKKAGLKFRKKFSLLKKFVCGTACIFRRNKGLEILIETAEIISKRRERIHFALIGRADKGDEWYEEKLRASVKEKKLKNFVFCGYGDKNEFMAGFDLYVMPSPNEPFGLVTIEAMAAGVPAVGFKSGGTAEIINDGVNGLLADAASPEALANRILYAYRNKRQMAIMSRNAQKIVDEKFSLARQVKSMYKVIEELTTK